MNLLKVKGSKGQGAENIF